MHFQKLPPSAGAILRLIDSDTSRRRIRRAFKTQGGYSLGWNHTTKSLLADLIWQEMDYMEYHQPSRTETISQLHSIYSWMKGQLRPLSEWVGQAWFLRA